MLERELEMDSKSKWAVAIALIVLVSSSIVYSSWQIHQNTGTQTSNQDTVFQFAAFNTFSTGEYAGIMTYQELEQHGDFGIGTFDGLDGEMLGFDGVFYQVPSTGIPRQATPEQTTPYSVVTFFHTDQTFTVTNLNYTSLQAFLSQNLPDDSIYAIKIHGDFSSIEARSPQKQSEPYPNLTDAIKTQGLFNISDASATAVGFRFPQSMNGIDYAGYHIHIITDDHTTGGHILNCQINNATIEIDRINNYNLILP